MCIQLFQICKVHRAEAFCCKMECYLFFKICVIVMQMSKFKDKQTRTHTHIHKQKGLVRRSLAPGRGHDDHADRDVHVVRVDLPIEVRPVLDKPFCWGPGLVPSVDWRGQVDSTVSRRGLRYQAVHPTSASPTAGGRTQKRNEHAKEHFLSLGLFTIHCCVARFYRR